jgi:hypothetical protein
MPSRYRKFSFAENISCMWDWKAQGTWGNRTCEYSQREIGVGLLHCLHHGTPIVDTFDLLRQLVVSTTTENP